MFKRYKGPTDNEAEAMGPFDKDKERKRPTGVPRVHAYSEEQSHFSVTATEAPPRIFESRPMAAKAPARRVPLQEYQQPEEEETEMHSPAVPEMRTEEPETTLGEGVVFKGQLNFQRLLRIDGQFEGELSSDGKLVVGPKGVVKSNVSLHEAIIEGVVEGDIQADRVELRHNAQVKGNVTARLLSVDEGVVLVGKVEVTG